MCGQYNVSNGLPTFTTGENIYLELTTASGVSIAIKRIKLSCLVVQDIQLVLRVKRETTAGTGGAAAVVRYRHPSYPANTTTALVKNGSGTFTLGTVTDTLLQTTTNLRGAFEWIARDNNDMLWSGEGVRLIITCDPGSATGTALFECDWVE